MHKIYNLIVGQTNKQSQEKAALEVNFQAVKTYQYLIGYLMILKRLCLSNNYDQNPIRSLCLATRCMYNTMHYANNNTTDYLVRFRNAQKVNEACNGRLITRGVQEHGMEILFQLHTTVFYLL